MKFSDITRALAVCSLLGGCANVQPWERENLAKPQMALNPDKSQMALRTHKFLSREAGAGSAEAEGGGCGCN